MAPLIVLVTAFGALHIAGAIGAEPFNHWIVSLRVALALMFLLTASAHWGKRRADLVAMVPPALPRPDLLVSFTGLAEIAGAIGLLVPVLAPLAASGLAAMLVAIFPANIHAARQRLTIGGRAVTSLGPRAAMQLLFLTAVLLAGFGQHLRG